MNKLTVLIVEDDITTQNNFSNVAMHLDDLSIIGMTDNSSDAINLIKCQYPDVVILDLELHCGGGNGIDVLQELYNFSYQPFILITTNNPSIHIHKIARNYGADLIFTKYQKNYSEESVLTFLLSIKNYIKSDIVTKSPKLMSDMQLTQYNDKIEQAIIAEFSLIGVSPKYVGYKYLLEAIKLWISGQTQNMTPTIANKYKKSSNSIEHAMQNAIIKTWDRADINDLLEHYTGIFSIKRGYPTPTEFVSYYTQKIKEQLRI